MRGVNSQRVHSNGKIRLYDENFRLIMSRSTPEGRKPDGISFSPDGSQIAVGYAEPERDDPLWLPAVEVISGTDLSPIFRPDLRGMDNGALWRVAWSVDGKSLYAAGTWRRGNRYPVRRWTEGGRGRPSDVAFSTSRILRIRSIATGGLAYSGEIPYLGVLDANDHLIAERQISIANFTNIGERFAISRDGMTVQFAFDTSGETPAHFSMVKRVLELGEAPAPKDMVHPVTELPDLDVRDWYWSYRPTLNEKPLEMVRAHEYSLSFTFAPDKSILLGTVWNIIRYSSDGKKLWSKHIPFSAHGVVATPDNRFVVAALGDGTIRWFEIESGKELVAFFPHRDAKRWIAWTYSGYYMASVGGDSLIQWQVNRGHDRAADSFPVGRFSERFYRPDIVLTTLALLDESNAVQRADLESGRREEHRSLLEMLPPVLSVYEPSPVRTIDSPGVRVRYHVRSPSGERIEQIVVRNDGHLLGTWDPPPLDANSEATDTLDLIVPQRDTNIVIVARNKFADSEPIVLKLKWVGQASDPTLEKHKVYVLAVGVTNYKATNIQHLDFPKKDAEDFIAALDAQRGKAYTEVVAKLIKEPEGTLTNILEGLKWLDKSVGPKDVGMLFLSGHGIDDRDGTFYFMARNSNAAKLRSSALPYEKLLLALRRIKGVPMLFIDACHSGDLFGRLDHVSMDVSGLINRLSKPSNGIIVYASSMGAELSVESKSFKNGAFTKALVEGFRDESQYDGRAYITVRILATYITERVRDLTAGEQHPSVNIPLGAPDLLVARLGN